MTMITLQTDHVSSEAPLVLSTEPRDEGACQAIGWTIRNGGETEFRGAVRLCFDLPETFSAPWFMIPGFLYGENRRLGQRGAKPCPRFDPAVTEPTEMTS